MIDNIEITIIGTTLWVYEITSLIIIELAISSSGPYVSSAPGVSIIVNPISSE
jgi:hypothetical protein